MVFQIQLTRRNDIVPLTRDYIGKCEKALAMRDDPTAPQPEKAGKRPKRRISEAGE